MTEPPEQVQSPVNAAEKQEPAPPMTPKLLARLFVVPFLIVAMIVGCSLAVWLLFGWISGSRQETLERLVEKIEAGTGEKVLDAALLPRDREVWQAAMELARRLEGDEAQKLTAANRAALAQRLSAALQRKVHEPQGDMGRGMQRFLLSAVGRLASPEGVPVVVTYATNGNQPPEVRRDALAALILMKDVPAARAAWPEIAGLVEADSPVLRIYATMAVGALAEPGDPRAVAALRRGYQSDDREVQWNAALALARLHDRSGLALLKDMLTRAYWEGVAVAVKPGDAPDPQRRLTPVQVEGYLSVAVDAAITLHAPELYSAVAALMQDPSPRVRDHAARAMAAWPAATQPGSAGTDARRRTGTALVSPHGRSRVEQHAGRTT